MLQHFGVQPYIVFDGDYLPSKAATELGRSTSRESSKKVGLELLKVGRSAQAFQTLQKAVDVTPEMARLVIDELQRCGVSYVVAPYEADAQLVYLEKQGIISAILSEDSDMLVFGAKILLTKLDKFGNTVMIRRENFTACRKLNLAGWTDDDFRRMCILSGCDYLANMKNMGLKNAHGMVRKYKNIDRIIRAIQFDGKFKVPQGYLKMFDQAEKTFLYQRVFDVKTKRLVTLNEPSPELASQMDEMLFIGPKIDHDTAAGVALGELHPQSKDELKPAPAPSKPQRRFNTPKLSTDSGPPGGDPPITSFFGKKRVPLAELDPNLFAPTPEQEALLASARGIEWNGHEAPVMTGQTLRRSSAPIVIQHPSQENIEPSVRSRRTASARFSFLANGEEPRMSQPLSERRNSTSKATRAPTTGPAKPRSRANGPKSDRPRLCSNNVDAASDLIPKASADEHDEGRSKFFTPKLNTRSKTKKGETDHDEHPAAHAADAADGTPFSGGIDEESSGVCGRRSSIASKRQSCLQVYLDDFNHERVAESPAAKVHLEHPSTRTRQTKTPAVSIWDLEKLYSYTHTANKAVQRESKFSIYVEGKDAASSPAQRPKASPCGARRTLRDSGIGFSPVLGTRRVSASPAMAFGGVSNYDRNLASPTASRKHRRTSESNSFAHPRVVVPRSDDDKGLHADQTPTSCFASKTILRSSPPRLNQGSEDSLLVHDSQSECGMSSDAEDMCAASPAHHSKVRVVDFQAYRFSPSRVAKRL